MTKSSARNAYDNWRQVQREMGSSKIHPTLDELNEARKQFWQSIADDAPAFVDSKCIEVD